MHLDNSAVPFHFDFLIVLDRKLGPLQGQPVGSMHLQFQGIALKNLQDKKLHR